MKQGRYSERVGGGAPVYTAAALQYICSEIVELAAGEAQVDKKNRITPRHIMLALNKDPELFKLLGDGDFAQAGVVPNIINTQRGGKKGKKCAEALQEEDEEEGNDSGMEDE